MRVKSQSESRNDGLHCREEERSLGEKLDTLGEFP